MPLRASHAFKDLRQQADPQKARILKRFFKTAPGEYGAGDNFLGILVPQTRKLAKRYLELPLSEIQKLLNSRIHEARLLALFILVLRFPRSSEQEQRRIYEFYLCSIDRVNNWDLVDLSAPNIVGAYLENRDRRLLSRLARSSNLWARRVAILATLHLIRRNQFQETLEIACILLTDTEDLIHKAVGWMLREVGKRDPAAEKRFLQKYHGRMPRTMLRYAIERFPEKERQKYLRASIRKSPRRQGA